VGIFYHDTVAVSPSATTSEFSSSLSSETLSESPAFTCERMQAGTQQPTKKDAAGIRFGQQVFNACGFIAGAAFCSEACPPCGRKRVSVRPC